MKDFWSRVCSPKLIIGRREVFLTTTFIGKNFQIEEKAFLREFARTDTFEKIMRFVNVLSINVKS